MNKQMGFTLVELMIVVAIVGPPLVLFPMVHLPQRVNEIGVV